MCTRKKYVTYYTTTGDARVHAGYVQFVGVFSLNCTRALDTSAILCTPKDRHTRAFSLARHTRVFSLARHTRAFSLARHMEGHPSCRLYLPYRICCTQYSILRCFIIILTYNTAFWGYKKLLWVMEMHEGSRVLSRVLWSGLHEVYCVSILLLASIATLWQLQWIGVKVIIIILLDN